MLTPLARSYISIVASVGAVVLLRALGDLHVAEPGLFGMLALLAVLGAGLKIRVPGVSGNVSLSFVPLILSSVILSLPEALLITAVAVGLQSTVFAKKFKPVQAAFNCGALILCIYGAGLAAGLLAGAHVELIQLALAGGVFYIANSVLVTTVIGLAENKPLRDIWKDCCGLYLPYFAAGLACALVAISGTTQDERRALQHPGLVILPMMLLTRQYFSIFFATRRSSGS
jgi:energy-converting hydrogenase Eha subunit A